MSNFVLNAVAQKIAEERTKELIGEYNNPELTPAGKKEVLEQKLMFAFLEGYNLKQETDTTQVVLRLSNAQRTDILQSLKMRLPTLVETSKESMTQLIDYVDHAGYED